MKVTCESSAQGRLEARACGRTPFGQRKSCSHWKRLSQFGLRARNTHSRWGSGGIVLGEWLPPRWTGGRCVGIASLALSRPIIAGNGQFVATFGEAQMRRRLFFAPPVNYVCLAAVIPPDQSAVVRALALLSFGFRSTVDGQRSNERISSVGGFAIRLQKMANHLRHRLTTGRACLFKRGFQRSRDSYAHVIILLSSHSFSVTSFLHGMQLCPCRIL